MTNYTIFTTWEEQLAFVAAVVVILLKAYYDNDCNEAENKQRFLDKKYRQCK